VICHENHINLRYNFDHLAAFQSVVSKSYSSPEFTGCLIPALFKLRNHGKILLSKNLGQKLKTSMARAAHKISARQRHVLSFVKTHHKGDILDGEL
jgi:hypothetical protein